MQTRNNGAPQLYSIPEAARICQVARGTIDRWHRECPDFPRKIRLQGAGSARFVAAEFDAWLLARAGRTATDAG